MASIFKKDKRKGSPWCIDYTDETGRRRRVVGCTDRTVTEQIARKLETEVELRKRGIISVRDDAYANHEARPLAEHLDDFRAHLIAKGDTTKHADLFANRIRRVVALIMGGRQAEIDPPKATTKTERERALALTAKLMNAARLSDLTRDRTQGALATLKDGGRSLQTCNHHRSAVRGFSTWAWKDGRTRDDALVGVSGFNAREDRRHDRRTLGLAELRRLIEAAQDGPTYRLMSGPARALCYRLAVSTGLRYAEIGSITPGSLNLDPDAPTVSVAAGYTKNGEPAVLPLPPDMAEDLARFVATLPAGAPVFPLPAKGAAMLRVDLKAAGISYRDAGGLVFDFHALRCQCATLADGAGVTPRVVQKLMRHSTLELTGRYTRPRMHDIEGASAALPSLRPAPREPAAKAATGTDPAPSALSADRNADADEDGPPKFFEGNALALSGQRTHKPQVSGSNPDAATCVSNRQQPSKPISRNSFRQPSSEAAGRPSRQQPSASAPIRPLSADQDADRTVGDMSLPCLHDGDPDLALIAERWPHLPEAIRAGIVAIVRASLPPVRDDHQGAGESRRRGRR